MVLNTRLLNYFEGINTNKYYKYGLLRDHYRTGAGSITLPIEFRQVVEEFTTIHGTTIASELTNAGAGNASQRLGFLLEDELLPEIGRGFTNGGNFSHLPPNVEQKMNEIYHEGYKVMTTQMECSVNGKAPVPDNLFFKIKPNGEIDFNNAVAMDIKLDANFGYDTGDPQRILALTQGTGTQFSTTYTNSSAIFGTTSTILTQIEGEISTLKSFSKIGTSLENDIYTLIHKPYNPR